MNQSDISVLPASEQLEAFRRHTLSPVDVLEAQISAEERLGHAVNAYTERFYGEARAGAREAERRYASAGADDSLPPLLGVTVAVKASHQMRGREEDMGVGAPGSQPIAEHDHPIVASLRTAGAILHARTTAPEFNCATVTHSRKWGVTRNPWNLERSPGGSSGGSAAAVAAGFSTMATATDLAGSIRVPASFSGLVGLKPPWGVLPGAGPMTADTYAVQGGLTRTVTDSVLFLRAVNQPDGRDLHAWHNIRDTLERSDGDARQARIGVSANLGAYDIDADTSANFQATIDTLREAGYRTNESPLVLDPEEVHRASFAHFGHIFLEARKLKDYDSSELSPYTVEFIRLAEHFKHELTAFQTLELEYRIQQNISAAFEQHDVLICPTTAVTSLEADGNFVGEDERDVGHYWQDHLTLPFNIAGSFAAISVPNGIGEFGIPTSVQVVARPQHLTTLIAVARAVESSHPIGMPGVLTGAGGETG